MKFLTGTMLAVFVGLMFVSLFHISGQMNLSHGMSGMSDCPFMAHGEVWCPMTLIDHIGAWKSLFFTLIPASFTLLIVLGVTAFLAATAPHLIRTLVRHRIPIHWRQLQCATYTYTLRPYQEQFSSGILHPKIF